MAKKKKTKKPVPTTRKPTRKSPAKKAHRAARTPAAAAAPSAKHQLLDRFHKEHATTLKVIRAYPHDKGGFQPHPRSSSAKKLIWTFAIEQGLVAAAIDGTLQMPPSFPPEPATLSEAVAAYEAGVKQVAEKLAKAPDARLQAMVPFFTGPGQIGDVPVHDIIWLMLMDSVHHRGQLSVYIRMAGGLVPSIYGPSADEPWM
jgi:uncharacterized damage-inducible protein DinB